MAQIMQPTQEAATVKRGKESGAGWGQKFGAVVGGVSGAMTGGPVGAIQGASAGASMGAQLGGMVRPGSQDQLVRPEQQGQSIQAANTGAVDRRLSEIQQNPHFQLQQAKVALAELPKEIQKEYAPTIESALEASRKAQKVGMA